MNIDNHLNEHDRELLSALLDGEADELGVKRLLNQDNHDAVNAYWQSLVSQQQHLEQERLEPQFANVNLLAGIQQGISDIALDDITDDAAITAGAIVNSASKSRPAWFKPAASFAIAASVAMVTIVGVTQFQSNGLDATQPAPATFANLSDQVETISSAADQPATGTALTAPQVETVADNQPVYSKVYPNALRSSELRPSIAALPVSADLQSATMPGAAAAQSEAAQQQLRHYMLLHTKHATFSGNSMMGYTRAAGLESE